MMYFSFDNIDIIGISCAVPKNIIDNTRDEDENTMRLVKVTGIQERRSLLGMSIKLVDLSIASAKDAIKKAGVDFDSIRVLLYVTCNPEFSEPSTAFFIQKELGLSTNCVVYDINLGCSGFVQGIQTASALLNSIDEENCVGVVINASSQSCQNMLVRNDAVLFGDAASTTIIKKTSEHKNKIIGTYFSDGNRYKSLFRGFGGLSEMDGDAVFHFSITDVPKTLTDFMEANNLTDNEVDYIVLHQAQKFIIDRLVAKAKVNKQKILYSLDYFGNTGGASIPVSICKNRDGLLDTNKVLACGFGVGLSWGIAYFTLRKEVVNKIIEVE